MHALARFCTAALAALAAAVLAAAPARAAIEVDITEGHLNPLPVAAPDFAGGDEASRALGADIARVIRANLERSALFRPVDPAAYIQRFASVNDTPRFADWQVLNAQALVVGQTTLQADGRLRVDFRLYDVLAGQEIEGAGQQYATTPDNWRRIAHKISDAIYERLTGERGYFDTRVVFIDERGPRAKRIKRLAIMDQDGANQQYLTGGEDLVLTPRFSPTVQQITYLSYAGGRPRVYLFSLDTNRREVLGDFSGMTFAPRFSPDGNSVVFTLETNGNSEIYSMDLRTRQTRRLTNHPAIDTSPSYSPDGSKIVFNSDRGGSPQLYVMNVDGSNITRITFGEGRFTAPVWSPRADLIAFTRQSGGRFGIGVIRPDGQGLRMLTESYLDEGPTWSPNGRVIMFTRQFSPRDEPSIWSVDLTGQNLRKIASPGDASDPAWSPLLP
jgi:TolB protein